MTFDIALLLAQDGVANGAIYVLVALGTVLIFVVTRVIFVPFGDIVAYAAMTLAAIQSGQRPGTLWLVLVLAVLAMLFETVALLRGGAAHRLPRAALLYLGLPAVPAAPAWLVGIGPATAGVLAFLVASALAGISGVLIGPVTTLYYDSGFVIGLKAFVGAIIGGLVSYPLAALGALFVGLLESYAAFWDSALKEVVVFGALIPVLVWRSMVFGHDPEDEEEQIGS